MLPLPIGILLIILCLPSFSAQAAHTSPPLTLLPCLALHRPAPVGGTLSPTSSARLLLAEPRRTQPRLKVPVEERVRVEAGEDLVSLLFLTPGAVTPWLGAGLEEEAGSPSAYRFGAGFDCSLGPLTRLNLGYRFSSQLGLELFDSLLGDDEEWHHFSLGLQKSF